MLLRGDVMQKAAPEAMFPELDKNNHWVCQTPSNMTELKAIPQIPVRDNKTDHSLRLSGGTDPGNIWDTHI